MCTLDLTEARIYVGTYSKYNEGSIFGKWLDVADYSDINEFYDACKELHHDEQDPEFMFQDFENIPDGLISECSLSPKVFEIIEELNNITDDKEALFAYIDMKGYDLENKNTTDIINAFRDDYRGQYDSEQAFADEEADLQFGDALNEGIGRYFDYDSYRRDLFTTDFVFYDGYVFYDI